MNTVFFWPEKSPLKQFTRLRTKALIIFKNLKLLLQNVLTAAGCLIVLMQLLNSSEIILQTSHIILLSFFIQ